MDVATPDLIFRGDLDAGRVGLGEAAKFLPPVHPGEVQRHDFLESLALSAYALAPRVSAFRITAAILGSMRAVSVDTALPAGASFRDKRRFLAEFAEHLRVGGKRDLGDPSSGGARHVARDLTLHARDWLAGAVMQLRRLTSSQIRFG